jgi:hypothetical protein
VTATDERYHQAIRAIDAANADDPNRLLVRGRERPKALGEAELATEWVQRLRPNASEALLLATRAHHVRRWEVPRASYPEGRAGYLRWRRTLHGRHAHHVAEILAPIGYDAATIERVQDIVRKRDLSQDDEVQAFEDALCIVFLETQLAELAGRLDDDKMVDVLRKTLVKMSDAGKAAAASVPLSDGDAALLHQALTNETPGG